jgi:N6-adenosine-specific RNA methylase IME4
VTRYRTIVADPPWYYEGFAGSVGYGGRFAGREGKARVKVKPLPYPSMTVEEIRALPVSSLAAKDARLFLWTTNRYLREALSIMETWGFEYAQQLVWSKTGNVPPFGGSVAPNFAEFLLVGRRGGVPVVARWPRSVIEAKKPNRDHSRKPEVFLDLAETVSPGPYLELFARRRRLGWDSWGNEIDSDLEIAA